MKRFLPFIVALFTTTAIAQTGQVNLPPSFNYTNLSSVIDIRFVQSPDMNQISYMDSMDVRMGHPYRIAVNIPVFINMQNSGTWTDLPDQSGRIWRLDITCPDARALGLYYSSFFIPAGSALYLYNENKKQVLGAYTDEINPESGYYATEMVQGDKLTLEYFEPYGISQEASINIEEIEYVYRGEILTKMPDVNGKASGACEVNINCSPEGTNWQDEKKGVCLLEIKNGSNTYLCSGSLVGNTAHSCIPYVLTADHCSYDGTYGYATTANLSQWKFYFHYEATSCSGTTASGTITKTGCTLKAHDTYGSGGAGSDFYLVQLTQSITGNNLYYNGWSKSTSAPASGVGIHHPSGDIMKISTYTSSLTSPYSTHWQVIWAATTNGNGVTEEGSSGSPLFNSTGLLIGTLTGGYSCCTVDGCGSSTGPDQPDYYGKFYYHWSSNGSTSAKQLKPWLDANNTNPTTLAGTYTCTPVSVSENKALNSMINIYPNPVTDMMSLTFGDRSPDSPTVKIYSLLGELVYSKTMNGIVENEMKIDLHMQPSGLYFLSLQQGNSIMTKKFAIQH
jgi:hypothetical protein